MKKETIRKRLNEVNDIVAKIEEKLADIEVIEEILKTHSDISIFALDGEVTQDTYSVIEAHACEHLKKLLKTLVKELAAEAESTLKRVRFQ